MRSFSDQRIEQGQQNLELATLNKLAAAFDIPIGDILVFDKVAAKKARRPKNVRHHEGESRAEISPIRSVVRIDRKSSLIRC